MKLAFFDDFKLGVVAGDKVVDVTVAVKDIPRLGPQDVMRGVIERFDALKDRFGCGQALCGACTMHVDGAATRSCTIRVIGPD